jgi:hypothetical protein
MALVISTLTSVENIYQDVHISDGERMVLKRCWPLVMPTPCQQPIVRRENFSLGN